MSTCCANDFSASTSSKKHFCPHCTNTANPPRAGLKIPVTTVLHHLARPWQKEPEFAEVIEQDYYFCSERTCPVVYFAEDNSLILQEALRTAVGQKGGTDDAAFLTGTLCYCFDVTYGQARQDDDIKKFVVAKTKARQCACEVRNPTGRCCLKDFPK